MFVLYVVYGLGICVDVCGVVCGVVCVLVECCFFMCLGVACFVLI